MADIKASIMEVSNETLKQWLSEAVRKGMELDEFVNALCIYTMKRGGAGGTNLIMFLDGWYHVQTPNGKKKFDNPREAIEYLFKDL